MKIQLMCRSDHHGYAYVALWPYVQVRRSRTMKHEYNHAICLVWLMWSIRVSF